MHISLKIVNLAIISLIYVSIADSQTYRGNPNLDDLVAAIATAAINGALPLRRMGNFGNPNRKGDVLRIPILLIRPNDFRQKKSNWNNKNGRPRNGRDSLKKDYSPKPKFPTHGLKVIPAPKEFEYEKSELKKNFDKKSLNSIQTNNRYNDRNRDYDDDRDRYEENRENRENRPNRQNEERLNRNRANNYNQNEEVYDRDRQNDRLPLRPANNWRELPEREPVTEDDDYENADPSLPALRPVLKVPTVVRHVYNAQPPTDSGKPTIPSRYFKSVADIPSTSDSSPEQYDNSQAVYQSPRAKMPLLSELLPPPDEQTYSYKTEPMVNHKYVNLGDVYRKTNNEEQEDESLPEEDAGPLAGYGKDQYDKQLISTLTKLMANSKNRSPMNIGGLSGGAETTQAAKPVTKTTKNYFTSLSNEDNSQTSVKSDSFLSKFPSIFSSSQSSTSGGQTSKTSKSSIPYTSQSQSYSQSPSQSQSHTSSSQSKIPESLLSAFSLQPSNTQGSSVSDYFSPIRSEKITPLQPGQVPLLPEVSRKPVSLDMGFDSRPLSAYSVFNAAEDSQQS